MTQVTVKELAQVVATPVERLLQQMREAGLSHTSAEQVVTDNEKQALLAHLKSSHGAKVDEPRKITLQRKTTTKLKVGGSKTISVEVRKKKTFVKRSAEEIEAEQRREAEEQRAAEEAARLKAEQEARERAEEEARRQEVQGAALLRVLRRLLRRLLPRRRAARRGRLARRGISKILDFYFWESYTLM